MLIKQKHHNDCLFSFTEKNQNTERMNYLKLYYLSHCDNVKFSHVKLSIKLWLKKSWNQPHRVYLQFLEQLMIHFNEVYKALTYLAFTYLPPLSLHTPSASCTFTI